MEQGEDSEAEEEAQRRTRRLRRPARRAYADWSGSGGDASDSSQPESPTDVAFPSLHASLPVIPPVRPQQQQEQQRPGGVMVTVVHRGAGGRPAMPQQPPGPRSGGAVHGAQEPDQLAWDGTYDGRAIGRGHGPSVKKERVLGGGDTDEDEEGWEQRAQLAHGSRPRGSRGSGSGSRVAGEGLEAETRQPGRAPQQSWGSHPGVAPPCCRGRRSVAAAAGLAGRPPPVQQPQVAGYAHSPLGPFPVYRVAGGASARLRAAAEGVPAAAGTAARAAMRTAAPSAAHAVVSPAGGACSKDPLDLLAQLACEALGSPRAPQLMAAAPRQPGAGRAPPGAGAAAAQPKAGGPCAATHEDADEGGAEVCVGGAGRDTAQFAAQGEAGAGTSAGQGSNSTAESSSEDGRCRAARVEAELGAMVPTVGPCGGAACAGGVAQQQQERDLEPCGSRPSSRSEGAACDSVRSTSVAAGAGEARSALADCTEAVPQAPDCDVCGRAAMPGAAPSIQPAGCLAAAGGPALGARPQAATTTTLTTGGAASSVATLPSVATSGVPAAAAEPPAAATAPADTLCGGNTAAEPAASSSVVPPVAPLFTAPATSALPAATAPAQPGIGGQSGGDSELALLAANLAAANMAHMAMAALLRGAQPQPAPAAAGGPAAACSGDSCATSAALDPSSLVPAPAPLLLPATVATPLQLQLPQLPATALWTVPLIAGAAAGGLGVPAAAGLGASGLGAGLGAQLAGLGALAGLPAAPALFALGAGSGSGGMGQLLQLPLLRMLQPGVTAGVAPSPAVLGGTGVLGAAVPQPMPSLPQLPPLAQLQSLT